MTHHDRGPDRLGERLRRSADRLDIPEPDLDRIRGRGRERRSRRRLEVIGLALLVALVGVGLPKRLVTRNNSDAAARSYFIRFPASPIDVAPKGDRVQSARFVAMTNLPDGTRYSFDGPYSSCCPQVEHGRIVVDTYPNESCFGLVGNTGNAPPYTFTITVQSAYTDRTFFGDQTQKLPTKQPVSVLKTLGKRFRRMRGPQVRHTDTGNVLVASTTYSWPTPQCGGPLPLFGGPTCPYDEGQRQLQGGDTLAGAMPDVMGAISQARMCEFWHTDLTPAAQASITWPAFAARWRHWYLDPPKRFETSDGGASDRPGLTWHQVSRRGNRYVVLISYGGVPLVRLQLEPLPNFCPGCGPNVVPFWGVATWRFL